MLLWPARVVTPQATYEPAHLRAEHGQVAELLDKSGKIIETMDHPTLSLVAEGVHTGQAAVTQRWHVTNSAGDRWVAELIVHCGCGSTRVTGTNMVELAW